MGVFATKGSTCRSWPAGSVTEAGYTTAEPPTPYSASTIRSLAHRILSQRQFRQPPKSWSTRLRGWVAQELDHFVNRLSAGGAGEVIGWAIIVIAVGAAALFVGRLARSVKRDPATDSGVAGHVGKRVADWESEALEHEQAGDWRQAQRCRFRALIAQLALDGVIEEVPGRTTREYETLVQGRLPQSGADFARASRLFEEVWYGNRAGGLAQNEQLKNLSRRVLVESGHR